MADLLSAASLLLAIVSVLYGLWYVEIVAAAERSVPFHVEDRTKPLAEVREVLMGKAVPVALAACLVAAVFLPDTVRLMIESTQFYAREGLSGILRYDAVGTSFCVVEGFAVALALHSMGLARAVSRKVRQLGG